MTHPDNGPGPERNAVAAGVVLHAFDESEGTYVVDQPPPEERVRRAPTDLLQRAVSSGGDGNWVRLARIELTRRGVEPPAA